MKILIRDINCNTGDSRIKREKEAVDALIAEEFGPEAIKSNLPSGEPVITIEGQTIRETFSISHCANLAVLAVNDNSTPVGVDVEQYRSQLRRVMHKFLNPEENAFYNSDEGLLKAWTLKEATYKAARTPGLALVDIHLPLDAKSQIISANGSNFRIIENRYIKNNVMLSLVVAL